MNAIRSRSSADACSSRIRQRYRPGEVVAGQASADRDPGTDSGAICPADGELVRETTGTQSRTSDVLEVPTMSEQRVKHAEPSVEAVVPARAGAVTPTARRVDGSTGESALVVEHLTKRFGSRVAFDNVSFEVGYGEVFGFLGPNGAGKTTTVPTLGTLIAPTSGSATVAGIPLSADNGPAIRARISLSKGLRQRVALARAILNDRVVLLLDEPASGLDPVATREVHELIASLRARGATIFLTTHRLAEAERLCDRVTSGP